MEKGSSVSVRILVSVDGCIQIGHLFVFTLVRLRRAFPRTAKWDSKSQEEKKITGCGGDSLTHDKRTHKTQFLFFSTLRLSSREVYVETCGNLHEPSTSLGSSIDKPLLLHIFNPTQSTNEIHPQHGRRRRRGSASRQ